MISLIDNIVEANDLAWSYVANFDFFFVVILVFIKLFFTIRAEEVSIGLILLLVCSVNWVLFIFHGDLKETFFNDINVSWLLSLGEDCVVNA